MRASWPGPKRTLAGRPKDPRNHFRSLSLSPPISHFPVPLACPDSSADITSICVPSSNTSGPPSFAMQSHLSERHARVTTPPLLLFVPDPPTLTAHLQRASRQSASSISIAGHFLPHTVNEPLVSFDSSNPPAVNKPQESNTELAKRRRMRAEAVRQHWKAESTSAAERLRLAGVRLVSEAVAFQVQGEGGQ